MDHGTRTHALYGGSAIERIIYCPGSVKRAGAAPYREPSVHAKEGTAAHELLDACLKNECFDAELGIALYGIKPVFETAEEIERQIRDAIYSVQTVLDDVLEIMEAYEDAVLYVERSFQLPSIDPKNTWGTCDVCIYVPSLELLYVIDFKHGGGEIVEVVAHDDRGQAVYENGQLLYYSTGAYYSGLKARTIVTRVIQPRAVHRDGPVRSHVVPSERLEVFLGEVNAAIVEAQKDDAVLRPGKKACRWCPANLECPAREARALQTVGSTFATVRDVGRIPLPRPADIAMDRIAYILQSKGILEDWLSDVEKYAYEHAMSGGHVPTRKLVEAQARRHWYGKDEDVAAGLLNLAGSTDWDDVYPRKLITITDAETMLKKAFRDRAPRGKKKQAAEEAVNAMAALTLKESSGKLVLVPLEDKRPAVNRAATAFATVQALPQIGT